MRKPGKADKKRILFLSVLCALTLLSGVCFAAFFAIGNMLEAQKAAERFRGDSETRFAQVSVFFPKDGGKAFSDIYAFRKSVDAALTEASLKAPETGSLWIDAYSARSEVTVTGTRGSAKVQTLGVGGDWFVFHPLRLRSGSYIGESDLMHDKVVLDEALAWKLFGGVDLAGMQVTIGGNPYLVAGVISREDDFASEKAYGDEAGMFMYYDTLNSLSETEISSYELCCADPVSGFALNVAETGFPDAVSVQNTGRFSFSSAFSRILSFGERSMSTSAVAFPYWENAARCAEDYTALMLAVALVFGLFPLTRAAGLLVRLFRRAKGKLSAVLPVWWERVSDNIRERQRHRLEEKAKSVN